MRYNKWHCLGMLGLECVKKVYVGLRIIQKRKNTSTIIQHGMENMTIR
jgi:hypothetical protein